VKPHILIMLDILTDVSTPHDRFIKTSHVSASTPAAHPSIRIPAVAHLRIGRQQDACSGPCSLRLLSPDESYDIINCLPPGAMWRAGGGDVMMI
jgi:hypothetical protein